MQHSTTKQQILVAARTLFAKHGFAETSMADVAARVKISKASLYYFFANKEAIYAAIAEDVFARTIERLEVSVKKNDSLPTLLQDLTVIAVEGGVVFRALDTHTLGKSLHATLRTSGTAITRLLVTAFKNHGIARPAQAAELTLNALYAYSVCARGKGHSSAPPAYARYIASLLMASSSKKS